MILRDYLKILNDIVINNPKALDLKVVTSDDDEGNHFTPVHYSPSLGLFEDNEFQPSDENPDAICLN